MQYSVCLELLEFNFTIKHKNPYSMYTVKKIRRFYGKITGNQLPVHFPLYFTDARKRFHQESGKER